MNNKFNKRGFTLIEILVAMAIIVTIVSMVYGSHLATSKSTRAYKARITLSQQGRKLLEQIARQIRCSYAGVVEGSPHREKSYSQHAKITPENTISYFSSNPDNPSGEILHLVTTNRISPHGLLEVAYKFDKTNGLLLSNQRRFVGTAKKVTEKTSWHPIAEGIKSFKLAFFDGRQWLNKWDFTDEGKLPHAVKINISSEDENHRQYHCSTTAYVYCGNNQNRKL